MNYFLKQVKLLLFNPRRDVAVERDWVSRFLFCVCVEGWLGACGRVPVCGRGRAGGALSKHWDFF